MDALISPRFVSRFPGTCCRCADPIPVGATVRVLDPSEPGARWRRVVHDRCSLEALSEVDYIDAALRTDLTPR